LPRASARPKVAVNQRPDRIVWNWREFRTGGLRAAFMRVTDQRQRAPWFENLKHRFSDQFSLGPVE